MVYDTKGGPLSSIQVISHKYGFSLATQWSRASHTLNQCAGFKFKQGLLFFGLLSGMVSVFYLSILFFLCVLFWEASTFIRENFLRSSEQILTDTALILLFFCNKLLENAISVYVSGYICADIRTNLYAYFTCFTGLFAGDSSRTSNINDAVAANVAFFSSMYVIQDEAEEYTVQAVHTNSFSHASSDMIQ